jgi:uncharacterized protein YjbJ (UPF0337 family)
MAIMNKDEVKGKFNQAAGKVKEKTGVMIGKKHMESEGKAQNAKGHIQEGWGKTKRKVSNAVEDVADAIND